MLTNELYFVIPAVLMAFLATCLLMPVLNALSSKVASDKAYLKRESRTGSRFAAVMGIFIAVAITFQLWGTTDIRTFHPYFFSALTLFLLSGYVTKKGIVQSLMRWGIQLSAAVVLIFGIVGEVGSYFALMGIEGLSVNLEIFLLSILILLITGLFSYMSRMSDMNGGIVIIITGVLGIWFWAAGFLNLAIFSFILSSSVIGYKMYSSNIRSLRLGSFGWSSLGFVVAFLIVEFLASNAMVAGSGVHFANSGNLILSLFIIPLIFLSGNVFKLNGKGDFFIVHLYKKIDMEESQIAFLFWMINLIIIGMAYSTMHFSPGIQAVILIGFGAVYTSFVYKAVQLSKGLTSKMSKMELSWMKSWIRD